MDQIVVHVTGKDLLPPSDETAKAINMLRNERIIEYCRCQED